MFTTAIRNQKLTLLAEPLIPEQTVTVSEESTLVRTCSSATLEFIIELCTDSKKLFYDFLSTRGFDLLAFGEVVKVSRVITDRISVDTNGGINRSYKTQDGSRAM